MGRKIEPTYLGDGVYATEDDRGIVLTTGTHVITEADNVIVLEPKVWAALKRWAEPSKDEEPRGDNAHYLDEVDARKGVRPARAHKN